MDPSIEQVPPATGDVALPDERMLNRELVYQETRSGLAIQHFTARGGELAHLVCLVRLVCQVYLVRRTRETRQTRAPDRRPLNRLPRTDRHPIAS